MTTHYIQTLGVAKCREILKGRPDWVESKQGEQSAYGLTTNLYFLAFDYQLFDDELLIKDLRAELSLHDTDSCTDIRNHLSPNTVVVG